MVIQNFNSDWKVQNANDLTLKGMFMGQNSALTVHLPHDAMIHEERREDCPSKAQTGFYPEGVYQYTKKVVAPKEWKEKKVVLEFEGVYQTAMVYVNGALAKTNLYGYSNFFVEIGQWLNYEKENEIKVIANNGAAPNSRWYTGSGIYRKVNLLIGNDVHFVEEGVRIKTLDANNLYANLEIEESIANITRERKKIEVSVVLSYEGKQVIQDKKVMVIFPNSKEVLRHHICVEKPHMWNCESPDLYECEIIIEEDGVVLDRIMQKIGIRTLSLDVIRGLCVNGETVKLRGTCIHHDNGILGAATLQAAEERRCRQLKEAGFNSIRSAHHPMSKEMLDACDKYGLLVMEEISDMWTVHKNAHDFALYFDSEWENVVERMVAKDFNHPCVVMYSIGNEIQEVGSEEGARINRKLCNKIYELDGTRFTINSVNGLIALGSKVMGIAQEVVKMQAEKLGDSSGSNELNTLMGGLMEGELGDLIAQHPQMTEALEGATSCDIIGLNYLTGRHVLEKELHPNMPVLGTETFPSDIVRLWDIVKNNDHVLGDFTWTGYDYLGEAGCGIFHYDGNKNFDSIYPERTCYVGDIDLIGYRRCISYLREVVYGLRKEPYIAVMRVDKFGQTHSKDAWMFKDCLSSWTWHGYEGKMTQVDVFSNEDEVELFLNNESLGKKKAGESCGFITTYDIAYQPGELKVISYTEGKVTNSYTILTAEETCEMNISVDNKCLKANGEDLSFITINFKDNRGIDNLTIAKKIMVKVEGAGELTALGNGNPSSIGAYDTNEYDTYDGYALAVVRAGMEKGEIIVTCMADGCDDQVVMIDVK